MACKLYPNRGSSCLPAGVLVKYTTLVIEINDMDKARALWDSVGMYTEFNGCKIVGIASGDRLSTFMEAIDSALTVLDSYTMSGPEKLQALEEIVENAHNYSGLDD